MNSEKIQSFRDLSAWQEGHSLILAIYKETEIFPNKETFGLTSQMRRAAVSITSNIAEGFSRHTYKDKVNFYSMALGSLTEVQNQLIIAKDINYLSQDSFNELFNQSTLLNKILGGLIRKSRTFIR